MVVVIELINNRLLVGKVIHRNIRNDFTLETPMYLEFGEKLILHDMQEKIAFLAKDGFREQITIAERQILQWREANSYLTASWELAVSEIQKQRSHLKEVPYEERNV